MRDGEDLPFMYSIGTLNDNEEIYYPKDDSGTLGNVVNNKNKYLVHSGKGQQTCDDKFCVVTTVMDLDENIVSDVVGKIPFMASIGERYQFKFALMNANDMPLTNYRIIIENPQNSLYFQRYNIDSVENANVSEDLEATKNVANNYKLIYRPLMMTPLETNNAIRGTIAFTPNKTGNATIKFKVIEDNSVYYTKEIYFAVNANKDMNVKVEPKVLPSYTPLNISVEARDANSSAFVKNATIVVKDLSDNLLFRGTTDNKGSAVVKLPAQNPGIKVRMKIYSPDYRPYILDLKTDDKFINITPSNVQMNLSVAKKIGSTKLKVENTSDLPVRIKDIHLEGDFDNYVALSQINAYLKEAYKGKVINKTHKYPLLIKANLSMLADYMKENKIYSDAKLYITFYSGTSEWKFDLPFTMNITLGKGLDNTNCLNLDVKKGQLISTDSKRIDDLLEITNGCTVDGQPVALRNLEARIKWTGNSLGSIVLNKDDRATKLQPSYNRSLAVNIPSESSDSYIVHLLPKSGHVVGDGKVSVLVQASYMTENGVQIVKNKVNYDVSVVNMHDCFSFELPDQETDLIKVLRNQETTFKVKNLCDNEADLRFDINPNNYVKISPNRFHLGPKGEKVIKVKTQYSPVGIYILELRAKSKGNTYQAIKTGINGFRVFVQPLPTDCIIMDNYEYNLVGTSAGNDKNAVFGYLTNRCLTIPVRGQYKVDVKTGSWSDGASWYGDFAMGAIGGISAGAGGTAANMVSKVGDMVSRFAK